jgi:hypothetical protein
VFGFQAVVIDPHHHRDIRRILGGGAQYHLFGTAFEMPFKLLTGPFTGRSFNNDIDSQISPGNIPGLGFGQHGDLTSGHIQVIFLYTDFIRELAQYRIESKQILKGFMISYVADGPQADILALVENTKKVSSDPAKAH